MNLGDLTVGLYNVISQAGLPTWVNFGPKDSPLPAVVYSIVLGPRTFFGGTDTDDFGALLSVSVYDKSENGSKLLRDKADQIKQFLHKQTLIVNNAAGVKTVCRTQGDVTFQNDNINRITYTYSIVGSVS